MKEKVIANLPTTDVNLRAQAGVYLAHAMKSHREGRDTGSVNFYQPVVGLKSEEEMGILIRHDGLDSTILQFEERVNAHMEEILGLEPAKVRVVSVFTTNEKHFNAAEVDLLGKKVAQWRA